MPPGTHLAMATDISLSLLREEGHVASSEWKPGTLLASSRKHTRRRPTAPNANRAEAERPSPAMDVLRAQENFLASAGLSILTFATRWSERGGQEEPNTGTISHTDDQAVPPTVGPAAVATVDALSTRAGSPSIPVKWLCLPSCEGSGRPAHARPHPSGSFPPAPCWHGCQDRQALPQGPCLDPGTPRLHCPRTGTGSKSSGWNNIWQPEVAQQNGPGLGAVEGPAS